MHLKIDVGLVFITATIYSRNDSELVLETASNLRKRTCWKEQCLLCFWMHSSTNTSLTSNMLWVRNPAGRRLPGEQQDTNRHGNACCSKLLSSAGYNIFLIARHPTTSSYKTAPVTFRQGSVWVWSVLKQFTIRRHTLTSAKESSVSVLTPKRGMLELVRLVLCMSFFTPLIWHMGFFSFSFCWEGISTSCCLSGETMEEREREPELQTSP